MGASVSNQNFGERIKEPGKGAAVLIADDDPAIRLVLRHRTGPVVTNLSTSRLLEDAARKGYIVAPDHLPFPGFGHIRKDGHAYTWVPVDYVNDAVEK